MRKKSTQQKIKKVPFGYKVKNGKIIIDTKFYDSIEIDFEDLKNFYQRQESKK
jgi:hypothetical protein